jgi:nucleoside-diphosphate-sugar epimerase
LSLTTQASVVVTGAGGFLGSRVVSRLSTERAALRLLYGPTDRVGESGGGARVHRGDIENRRLLAEVVSGADCVLHLAGPPSVRRSFADPVAHARAHVAGTAAVVEACATAGVKRIVYVSSAEIYGNAAVSRVGEDVAPAPRSPYAAAKLGAEAFVRSFAECGGDAVVLRPFSIYGPRQSPDCVLQRIIDQTRTSSEIALETLRPIRDYVHVDDVAEALMLAWQLPLTHRFRVYNIGTGTGTSIRELAQAVLRAAARELPLSERTDASPRASDIHALIADASRARSELGWVPLVTLEVGLLRLLAEPPRSGA